MPKKDTTKVYSITLMVVDHDGLGVDGVADVIENQKYPNRCIHPRVMTHSEDEVEWSDDHPLNRVDTQYDTFMEMFHPESM